MMFRAALATLLFLPAVASAQVTVDAWGICPGSIDADFTGLTASGNYAVISSSGPGAFAIPAGQPCAGTITGLAPAGVALRMTGAADATGFATVSSGLPAGACGLSYQVLDVTTCMLSAVETVPLPATPTTIPAIQTGSHLVGEIVSVQGAISAVAGNGFFMQHNNTSAPNNGIWVFAGFGWEATWGAAAVGDWVAVNGAYEEFFDLTEINVFSSPSGFITPIAPGAAPTPAVVSLLELNTAPEPWEGVLVEIQNVTTSNPDAGFGEWEVTDGGNFQLIDDMMWGVDPLTNPIGTPYTYIRGPLTYSFGAFKIEPRDGADLF